MPRSANSLLARAGLAAALALAVLLPGAPVRAQDAALIEAFTRPQTFEKVKISPDGTHLAVIVPVEDRAILVMLRRADLAQVGAFSVAGRTRVSDFWWVTNERLLLSVSDQQGFLDNPTPTGEIFAVDVDGSNATVLVGRRSAELQLGTRLGKKDGALVYGSFVSLLAGNDRQVLVASTPIDHADPGYTTIDKLDVRSGQRNTQTKVLVPFADVLADHQGNARFASGQRADNYQRLFYRAGPDADWVQVNDESQTDRRETAVGFSADDKLAYLRVEQPTGPAALVALDLASGQRTEVARDARVDPDSFVLGLDDRTVVAARFYSPAPRLQFIEGAPDLRLARSLAKAFQGLDVDLAGGTVDRKFALATTRGDREPGAAYLYDVEGKRAALIVRARDWLDPATLAEVKPFEFTARDGTPIQGTLTLPRNVAGTPPLIVNPHGGPYGVADLWGFDEEAQLLAAHGYAVLKVNFRGSGNYGRAFQVQGFGQWGRLMQDDVTDATRAAVAQGLADPQRICLYGGSYGAYAALMGPVREPGLYRCVAGYVGVYDLPMMFRKGAAHETAAGRNFLADKLGEDMDALRDRSPVAHAAQVKVPVFLAAGGEDQTAPVAQSRAMRDALTEAGNAPDWLVYPEEGHGFYLVEHQREYYRRLLAFLGKNLGVATPATTAAAAPSPSAH